MSDRYNALVVVLEADLKDEDVHPLIEAIKQFRGVLTVKVHVSDMVSILAEERAKREIREKLYRVFDER
jgi:hypothetical protein